MRDYLFEAIDSDRGAHGPFDDEAKGSSVQLGLAKRRGAIATAAAAALGAGVALKRLR